MTIRFFLRKKVPAYFSIEQIFLTISSVMPGFLKEGVRCEIEEVPFYFSFTNCFRNIRFVRRHAAEINHITGDIHYAILGCPATSLNVLTIHDCVMLGRFRKFDPRYWLYRLFWYDLPMRKADLITVVSEKTRSELLEKIGYGNDKIVVVNNFVNPAFRYSPGAFNKARPTLLFIGSTVNKNLDRVLGAIKGLSCRLEIIGKISAEQQRVIEENGIEASLFYALPLEQMIQRFSACDMVLFPSLYEGFGMLIVEANAVGRPVLTSDLSPMKEVAGKAAALVDPLSEDSIRAGIVRIIEDDEYREVLVREGLANISRYSLETAAGNYIRLYEQFGSRSGVLLRSGQQ